MTSPSDVPGSSAGPLDPAESRELMEEFARTVLEQAAPEELVIFEDTADQYFRDPEAVLDPKRRDEAVGFGLEVSLLTPYVLAVATPVLAFLGRTVADAVKAEVTPVLTDLVRRLLKPFRPDQPTDPPATRPVALTPEQAAQVHTIALERASDLGLPPDQARLLSDAVVGGLVVRT